MRHTANATNAIRRAGICRICVSKMRRVSCATGRGRADEMRCVRWDAICAPAAKRRVERAAERMHSKRCCDSYLCVLAVARRRWRRIPKELDEDERAEAFAAGNL